MVSKIIISIIAINSFFIVYCELTNEDGLVVHLPKGAIRGRTRTSANGSEYYSFQDIPFAAPPTGENRFKVPKPPRSWKGILNTTDNVKECMANMQFLDGSINHLGNTQSEDCLYLNVYTPVKPGSIDSLPVFVFIHGGKFLFGNGWFSSFGPKYLVDHNIIVVTMNYRLGAFGFLATTDGIIPGNLGLKDQNFALKWVQENIHLFGGNPKKVTIGGQSAGGVSAGYHVVSQQSKGLFSSAILQSGSSIHTWGFQTNPDGYAFKLGNILDNTLGYTNSSKLLSVLLKASANDISAASVKVLNDENTDGVAIMDLMWAPIIEDKSLDDTFISDPMYGMLQDGKFNKVPILIGFTSEESLLFVRDANFDEYSQLYDNNPSLLVNDKFHLDAQNKSAAGSELRKLYTGNTSFAENWGSLVRFTSDSFISRSSTRHAAITSRFVPTYLYKFSYGNMKTDFPDTEHVPHAQEMRFIWEKSFNPDSRDFDNVIRQQTLKLWTNFMKYHDPTPSRDPLLMNIIWPKVEPDNILYLNIDETLNVTLNPRQYNEVSSILDSYIHSPLATY
nr:juvenile hormone esterase-like [Leptinotarsa decemlineata]